MRKKKYLVKNLYTKTVFVFLIALLISGLLSHGVMALARPENLHIVTHLEEYVTPQTKLAIETFIFFCIVFGILLTTLIVGGLIQTLLRPIRSLSIASEKVAQGKYDKKLPMKGNPRDEMNMLIANFNKMTSELSAVTMLNNSFISNMSHEFKTPISSIRGFATILRDSDVSAEHREYAQIIVNESERLSTLATNILQLTKLENQVIVADNRRFALDEQLRSSVLLLQSEWLAKSIEIDVDLQSTPYVGNAEMIQQIWLNLLSNAIKFTHDRGRIVVSCHIAQSHDGKEIALVSVKDNGIGMSAETCRHVFEKFYQADRSHSGIGNGLGLALAKRIVVICEGTIEVVSELGKGTECIVRLPWEGIENA